VKNRSREKRFLAAVPPWVFIGAVAVLFPIFTFVTLEDINRQKESSIRLLLEKGAALIRSFEAGTRTGMMGMGWDGFQLQKLLTETAQQPDIVYLLVTDHRGTILAHNDAARIGGKHGKRLDLSLISHSKKLNWRLLSRPDGKKIFEVVRKFSPTGDFPGFRRGHMMLNRLFQQRFNQWESDELVDLVIFVGLDMRSVEEARRTDTRHTVIMTSILLLVGFAGIILLFLAQGYRSTRASLSRIKAFSGNLVENMPIGLLATDNDGRIASLNQVAGHILNLSSENAIGEDVKKILPPQLWGQLKGISVDKRVVGKEIDCSMHDGRVVPLEVSASFFKDEAGTVLGLVTLFKDLTEVRLLKQEVVRSQRLATVGRLAAGIAHEIRNPLSSIKGFATYFKERYQEKPEDQQVSNIMIQEVDRLNKVVGQLLDFAKPVIIAKVSVSLKPFIEDSLKLVTRQAEEKGITIQTDFHSQVDFGFLDPDRINQVLLNLYLNAIESMNEGGCLSVTLSVLEDGEQIEIRVSDTGNGIRADDLAHIFDPYFTTKNSGTGLGLAIVHNILENHGGEIKVESRSGQGTTIRLLLPNYKNNREK
tara:strand:- start:335 stop:2107 length:1773 start_codon:yes stop_codon:yes gene_type:complete